MKKFYRYLVIEYLRLLFILLLGVIFIYLLVHFFERIDKYVEKKANLEDLFLYYLNFVPYLIVLLLPLAEMLAVFFLIGDMEKSNEMMAIRTSGIDVFKIFKVIFFMGLIFSIFSFLFNEFVVCKTLKKSEEIMYMKIEKRRINPFKRVWARKLVYWSGKNRLYYFDWISAISNSARKIIVMDFEGDKLVRRIDAFTGDYILKDSFWIFYNGVLRIFKDEEEFLTRFIRRRFKDLKDAPFEILTSRKKLEYMNFLELKTFIRRLRNSGFDYKRELTEFYYRFSFPFTCVVILIFALPLVSFVGKEGKSFGFGISLVLAFFYWALFQLFKNLGYGGQLNPFISVIIPNLVFLSIGFILLRRVKR